MILRSGQQCFWVAFCNNTQLVAWMVRYVLCSKQLFDKASASQQTSYMICSFVHSLFLNGLQAISSSWMIHLNNPHAVNLDTSMKTPYQISSSSSNSLIMQSMSFTTTPIPGTSFANHSLVFFGLRDINNPGNFQMHSCGLKILNSASL